MSLEFPSIGQVCSLPECGECDFLPFQCSRCSAWYCHVHLNGHECAGSALVEGRIVSGEGGVPLEESEAFLADQRRMAQNACDHCHQYNRYLVNCLQSGCKGKRYCVEHRDHYEHAAASQAPSGSEAKPKLRIQPVFPSTAAVGTRASLPAPLGRMRGSSGVLVALVVGGPVPSTPASSASAFHCEIESVAESEQCHKMRLQLVGTDSEEVPLHRRAKLVHTSSTTSEPPMQMHYYLCFVRILSLGSSLGNLLEMVQYSSFKDGVGASAPPSLDANRVQIGIVHKQRGAVIRPNLSALCQDALSDRSLLLLSVDGPSLMDSEWSQLSNKCGAALGGFLKPARSVGGEGKGAELAQAPASQTALNPAQAKETSASIPSMPLPAGLRFPLWTDIQMKNTKGTPRGSDFVKGVPPAQKILIAVVSLIPIALPPPPLTTEAKAAESPLLKLPLGLSMLANQAWSKGKLLDRVVDEFRDGIYNVEDAAGAMCKFIGSPKLGLELYSLSSCGPLEQCTDLKQGDVLALFLKGGLPGPVVEHWQSLALQPQPGKLETEGAVTGRPLLEAKDLPKDLRLRHMKDCVIC